MAKQKEEQVAGEQDETGQVAGQAAGETGGAEAESADSAARPGPEEELSPETVVENLQQELGVARDNALRAYAEAQNTKRRAEQDVEKARKFALEQFARELLGVVDNLERALEATAGHEQEETVKPITEGVQLTLKSFLDVLKKFNIEPVDPQGEPFDPNLHQAMSMIENSEVEPNSVIAVMQKGYTLNGRLLRPAMVMVSKAAG